MTLVANVKGYINGDEWGVVEQYSLKSYEEIYAMATAEGFQRTTTIAELNNYGEEYYTKLSNESGLDTLTVDGKTAYAIKGISYYRPQIGLTARIFRMEYDPINYPGEWMRLTTFR